MSLVVEITKVDSYEDLSGLTSILRTLTEKISTSIGFADFSAFNSVACRGILQNNLDISFTNKWDSTVYQGVMSGIDKLTQVADGAYGKLGKVVTAAIDFSQTALNMGGMSMIGAGAASTKMYGGSNISGLTVSLKWYTPQATKSSNGELEYSESIKALMSLGFPTQRSGTDSKVATDGKVQDDTNKISKTLETLFSINPPPVRLTIYNGNVVVYNLYPLIITNIQLTSSRETYNGKPIVVGANVSFDFYQIKGNGGYNSSSDKDKFKFAGIDLLDNIKPTSKVALNTPVTTNNSDGSVDKVVDKGDGKIVTQKTDSKGDVYIKLTQTQPGGGTEEISNYTITTGADGSKTIVTKWSDFNSNPRASYVESYVQNRDGIVTNKNLETSYAGLNSSHNKLTTERYSLVAGGTTYSKSVSNYVGGKPSDKTETEHIGKSELPPTPSVPYIN